jgi:hypothetical protein
VNGIPLQKVFFPFCKGEKRRCLAGEERRLPFEGKKIPAHMTRAYISEVSASGIEKENVPCR